MNDSQIIAAGKRCAQSYKLAQELERKIDDEIVKKLGFKNVKDYEAKTGIEHENDVIIDSLHHDFVFTKKTLKDAIEFQECFIKNG